MSKVSVIIPTFNSAHLVGQAIKSVLEQTYSDFELIVVDDGSKDKTGEVLASFGDRIRVITQENKGVAVARNVGIENATGEYIAFLDADDVWLPSKLDLQVKLLQQNPEVSIIYGDAYMADENGQIFNSIIARHRGRILATLLQKNVVGNPSLVILRKACFSEVGLFDPQFKTLEDWDMWLRLATRFQFGFVPQPLIVIREQRISRSRTAQVAQNYRHDLEIMYHRQGQNPAAVQELGPISENFIQALIHFNVGNCWLGYYEQGAQSARLEFLAAIRLAPTMPEAYLGLTKSLLGTDLTRQLLHLKWELIGLWQRKLAKPH